MERKNDFLDPLAHLVGYASASDVPFVPVTMLIIWIIFLIEMYLCYRQHVRYVNPGERKLPKEIRSRVTDTVIEQSRVYNIGKNKFHMANGLFEQLLNTVIVMFGIYPAVWKFSGETVLQGWFGVEDLRESESLHTIVFVDVFTIVQSLLSLPSSLYYQFVLEENSGFNNQSLSFFIADKIKQFLLLAVFGPVVIYPVVNIVRFGGESFYIYVWMFLFAYQLIMLSIYPVLIAPIFDKYVSLPSGDLKTRIEQLAQSLSFPLKKLQVVIASKRSSHSNAYFYGFFNNKRVVLFDTLLDESIQLMDNDGTPIPRIPVSSNPNSHTHSHDHDHDHDGNDEHTHSHSHDQDAPKKKHVPCSTEEILGILAHEFGHWKLNHTLKQFVINQLVVVLSFMFFGKLMNYQPLMAAFGFPEEPVPIFIALMIIFQYLFHPIYAILNLCLVFVSRRFEFQADAFADAHGFGSSLKSALVKLCKTNLGDMDPDPLFSAWYHSHPPLIERLRAITGKDD